MENTRDNFLKSLSNYSECIRPYLRQVQEKYVASYYMPEFEKVELTAYCTQEREQATAAQAALEKLQKYWTFIIYLFKPFVLNKAFNL